MSTQSEAKKRQRYIPKYQPQVCGNCRNFTCASVQIAEGTSWQPEGWWQDKNLRCTIGGFAVKKLGTCNEWTPKN